MPCATPNPRSSLSSVERDRNPEPGRDEVTVTVADDGQGMREPGRLGYGLVGVSERVGALGGQLSFANTSSGGFSLIADHPTCRRVAATARRNTGMRNPGSGGWQRGTERF
jgi:hypothetical protein